MAKALFYRLFGIGKFPEQMAAQLKSEGILLLDEGVKSSTTYRNFRAPGRYASLRRTWSTASIALTELRLVAVQSSLTAIDVPLSDERIRGMKFSQEKRGELLVTFDAALFHEDWSGKIEYRFNTEQAQDFVNKLRERVGGDLNG